MAKLSRLVQNENVKIYTRLRTWIFVAITVAAVLLFSIVSYNMAPRDTSNWEQIVKEQVKVTTEQLRQEGVPQAARAQMEQDLKVWQYTLDDQIASHYQNTLWSAVKSSSALILVATIFTVVIAADAVAGEFSAGTIKMLLIRPAARTKILLAKYISVVAYSLFLLLLLFTAAFLSNSIIYGFNNLDQTYVYLNDSQQVVEGNMFLATLRTYSLQIVELLIIITLAFMVSSVFQSGSMAISISLVALFAGPNLVYFLGRKYEWMKYTLFANMDLNQYFEGAHVSGGLSLPFSLTVLLIYYVLMLLASFTFFSKRDVY